MVALTLDPLGSCLQKQVERHASNKQKSYPKDWNVVIFDRIKQSVTRNECHSLRPGRPRRATRP